MIHPCDPEVDQESEVGEHAQGRHYDGNWPKFTVRSRVTDQAHNNECQSIQQKHAKKIRIRHPVNQVVAADLEKRDLRANGKKHASDNYTPATLA